MSDSITVDRARSAIKEYYGDDKEPKKKKTKVKKAKKIEYDKSSDWVPAENSTYMLGTN